MSSRHAPATYNAISRFNHWLVALVMIGMLALGLFLENVELSGATKGGLMGVHKAIGTIFLVFGVWRVGYRLVEGFPQPAAQMPAWQDLAAKAVHWALLAGILLMPLSGLMMSLFGGRDVSIFGLFSIPAFEKNETLSGIGHFAHGMGANLLLAAIAVHVLAALKHHFFDKDITLTRMIGSDATGKGQTNV